MIRTFYSWDEAMAPLDKELEAARERAATNPLKIEDLGPKDCFVCERPDLGVLRFGVVVELKDPDAAAWAEEHRRQGFVFGRFFSPLCVEGELDDTHITRIAAKIPRALFERARANGWRHREACS